MPERLPPLTAFRAFDAAARHMSFAKAADELHVTPAALSFQIKSLEEHLGHPLFHRLNRAVELTDSGKVLAPGAAEGFATLAKAWGDAKKLHDTRTLTVTAGPGFTSKWLAPRALADRLKTPEDLLNIPLLHQDDTTFLRPKIDWDAWFSAAGVTPPTTAGTHFGQADHTVRMGDVRGFGD